MYGPLMENNLWLMKCRRFLRVVLILLNNVYTVPSFLIWMLLLHPLLYFQRDWYFTLEGILFSWLEYCIAFWTWNAGFSVVETGDDVTDCLDSECLVIVNHQSTGDVPTMMQSFTDAAKRHLTRHVCWILDDMFKYTHFGLACRVHGDFFILQGKQTREGQLNRLADHLRNVYVKRDRTWIVLFPEGGFLRNRRTTSQQYAQKNGYPHLEHITLPRVGVIRTVLDVLSGHDKSLMPETNHRRPQNGIGGSSLKSLKYLIDVTIGYSGGKPVELLNNIVTANSSPRQTTIHYRRYPISLIPRDEDSLLKWLYERYAEKDALLDHFYRTGSFPQQYSDNGVVKDGVSSVSARVRPVLFSETWCLLVHAFYIASTCLHFYMISKLCSLVGSILF